MKKNVIAVMLSLVMAVGSVGTAVPAFAAEEGTTTEVAVEDEGEVEVPEDKSEEEDSEENAEDAEQTESAGEESDVTTEDVDTFSENDASEDTYDQPSEDQNNSSGTEEESVSDTNMSDGNEQETPEVTDDTEILTEESQQLELIMEAQEKARVWKHANQITISYDTAEDLLLKYSIYDQNTDDLLYSGELQQSEERGYYYVVLDFDAINENAEAGNAGNYDPVDITDIPVKVVLDDGTYQYEEIISGKAGTISNLEVDSETDGQLSVTWDSTGEVDGFYLAARGTEEGQPLSVCIAVEAEENEAVLNISKEDVREVLAVPFKFDQDTGAKYYGETAVYSFPNKKDNSMRKQVDDPEEVETEQVAQSDEQLESEASDIAAKASIEHSGTCGGNLTWTLDSEGTLTISGTGDMTDYSSSSITPWYDYKDSIKSVKIASGVTDIGGYAFHSCYSLTSVTIPDGVTSIGSSAFDGCSSLTSVKIPDSVQEIWAHAFYGCSSLTSVTIPERVVDIQRGTFSGCSNLTSVTIPNSVSRIQQGAFQSCSSLTSVTIPDSVWSIEKYAFQSCSSLTSVTIPDSVWSIEKYAFQSCSSLTSVTISKSVTSIEAGTFSECSSLRSVTIPNSVTTIGDYAFSECNSLTSVMIGNSVTSIGSSAFDGCSSLRSVKIPDSVSNIGYGAFWGCSSLSDIYYTGGEEEWKQIKGISEAYIPSNATIHYNWPGEIPADGVQYITATLGEESYKYEGKPVEPKPTVTLTLTTEDGTETRELSQDEYTITYENNDKPGKATLTVSGTGEYSGLSDTVEFTINSVVGVRYITAVLDNKIYKYEGKPVEPKPTVYYYETTEDGTETRELSQDEYTITYEDNDKPGKATLTVTTVGDYSGLSNTVFFTITEEENLKITQPSGGKNYAFAGDVQKKKTFTMTLDQADEEPKKSDFKFEIKKSGNLNTTPSSEVSDPSVEVLNIKKTADRKYTITFDYAPDETGFYGLTVSYKDNVDDAELMVYDSNILEKLEADLDGTVNKYYKSYSKRVSKEIEKLMKETEAEPDYVQLAQKLMQDSSNVLAGTQIGDSHVDKDSVNLCAFEAYARFIYQTGGRSGVHFDEVENNSAAIKIVNTINGYIIDNGGVTESDVPLNSKVIIDGKEYSAKASWNIWSFGAGQIFVKVVDKNGNVKSYENSITSLVKARAATANYCEALKDLEISSMKNIANCWYTELVDVLGWDILDDVDSKRQEMIKVVSDDITQGLEKRGIKNILDNIKSCHTYYKQARGFIEKLEKLDNVFKNPKSTSEMILSVYRIKNMDTLSLEPGDCSEDIYNLVKNGEEKWREYMYEYFTTGTVKELEPDTVFDVLKNGVKNIFNCPINITVYDPSGNISGYIGDDDLWFNDDIFIKEEGDTKIIYTPKTGGYHFGVTGTGHGTVTYTAEELSDGEANGSRLNYYDLPVEIGTEINIGLNSGSLSSGADISVNTPDSSYEPETVDHSSAITVTVDNGPEKGTVTGAGPYVAGDVVTLTATPNEEYHFVGWYENDQLKSHKKSYRFVARKDITLTARYIERKEDENILDSGTCGENVTWKLDDESTLTISGAGEMANYRGRQEIDLEVTYSSNSPWFDYGIKTVIIEDGVTSIGRAAFCGCGKLERVEIPDSVTTIGEWAFSGCGSLDCIEIPEGVTSIGEKLFAYCINLRSVTIPVGVRSIGNSAFISCKKLTDIEIPPNVTTIGAWAFIGCNSLTDIIIPEGIKTISGSLFEDCFNLVSVTIPNSVTSIKEDAFNKCNGLTDIYYGGSRKSWDAISIGNNNTALTDATLHLSLANAEVSGLTNKTYTGKAITQNPVVTLCGETLLEGTDYRVSYANNTNAGTATVNIIGVVNYEGTVTSTFNINKAANKITASNRTLSYSTKARSLSLNVKATAGKISYKSNNTKVKVTSAGKVTIPAKFSGTAKITITAAGSSNYNKGTKTITITVPAKITLSSVSSPSARKMRVVWKKNTSVTGYQIQYSLKSSFASPKTVTIGKNTQYAKTFSGLTRGKKYYVRIRSYKTVSGKKYYSAWSATKATTIKK